MSDDDDASSSDTSQSTTTPNLCTYAATGSNPSFQSIYLCRTCNNDDDGDGNTHPSNLCLCQSCAIKCHSDHDVEYIGMGASYCDCRSMTQRCAIEDVSSQRAAALGVEPGPMTTSTTITTNSEFRYRAYDIASLDDNTCRQFIRQAETLIQCSKQTFWVGRTDAESSSSSSLCELETLARRILTNHCDLNGNHYLGAEWWVQVNSSIDLHYDKDETLAEEFQLGSFPALSTVTYLTSSISKPTLVFHHLYAQDESAPIPEMVVSFPRRGKHLVFDGRLLHGAPSHPAFGESKEEEERVTVLVNLWHSKPANVNPLPEEIRNRIMRVGKKEQMEEFVLRERAIPIHTLTEAGESILLPFVSKHATWIEEDDDDDGGLMVKLFLPPSLEEDDVVKIEFGKGMEASCVREH